MGKILVLCDDLWHPAEVIERGICGLGDGAYSFDVVKSAKDILTPKRLEQYDAVIIAKSNNVNAVNAAPWFEESVTEVGPEEFRAYLERGGGIVFVHSGTCIGERFLGDADERFKKPARDAGAARLHHERPSAALQLRHLCHRPGFAADGGRGRLHGAR